MTTACKITFVRVFLIPVFFIVLLWGFPGSRWVALAIFIVAGLTDYLDGYVARHCNQVTNLGRFLDPLADKLLVTAALLVFVEWGQMPAWCVMLVLAREFAVTGLRLVAVEGGRVIAAAWSGKIKTSVSLLAICLMLTPWHDLPLLTPVLSFDSIGTVSIVLTTLWSGAEYFLKNRDVFGH
jgi:CDP-diacylglycerol--glycerol-3-phosphate 3-phosphatidyltransferase